MYILWSCLGMILEEVTLKEAAENVHEVHCEALLWHTADSLLVGELLLCSSTC